jgi:MinD superfamily P-loop ATPase
MTVTLNKNVCDKKPSCMMVTLCPASAISIRPGEYPMIDPIACEDCGKCVAACPHQALSIA